ncbi:MAG: hypothetical protein K2H64_00820 [Desulfovibrio sp.]|nr:hypothetical protein [Desulfovibrio sp.]
MKRCLSVFLSVALALAVLPGCASKYGEKRTVVNYYPACYSPIQDLRDREHDVAKGAAGGAVVGALGGALIGLLASGGKASGALAGAAAGGIVGATAGSIYASKQKERDDNIRLASYLQDMDGDISNMDIDAAAARTSFNCYEEAFKRLVADIKAKRVSAEVASKRYEEIRNGEEEAAAIFADLVVRSQDLRNQYEQAFVQEEQQLATPQKVAQGNQRQKVAALKKARANTNKFASKKQQYSTEKQQINKVTAQNNHEYLAAMSELEGLGSEQKTIRS